MAGVSCLSVQLLLSFCASRSGDSVRVAGLSLPSVAKKLIIAEKPSVANDIARSLGGFTRHGDYFESRAFVLSSAIGHLLELVPPEGVEVKRGKWSFANLPVIPPHFDLQPIERSEDRLKLLEKLLKRKDVGGVINACDAGREGELIFRYIMQHAGNKKPIERLWLQSMTPVSIRGGFRRPSPGSRSAALWLMLPCAAPNRIGSWESTAHAP